MNADNVNMSMIDGNNNIAFDISSLLCKKRFFFIITARLK